MTAAVEGFLPEQPRDPTLLLTLHPAVSIHRCRVFRPFNKLLSLRARYLKNATPSASNTLPLEKPSKYRKSIWQQLKDAVSDVLATPDQHVGWIPSCYHNATKVLSGNRPDAILVTASPWSSFIAAMLIKHKTRLPVILDFRDPWTRNPSFPRRTQLSQLIQRRLEAWVIDHADGIVANTDELAKDLLLAHPRLAPQRVTTITNGFERFLPTPTRTSETPLTIAHVGELYFQRDPTAFLKAIRQVLVAGLLSPSEIQVQLVGGVDPSQEGIQQLLADPCLLEVLQLIPRLPYKEAQKYVLAADILLLVQPDFPLQVPRKLYEYLAVRKPMLCLAEQNSATATLVNRHALGEVCENDVAPIVSSLTRLIDRWRRGQLQQIDINECSKFQNSWLSSELLLFVKACIGSKAHAPRAP